MAAASTPRRGNDKRIAKTPSTTPRTKPKALLLTPHRHQALAAAGEGTTPSNRRKRIKSHFEEAGMTDAGDSILHKVREHNLTSNRKTALQPLCDNQLPLPSTKVGICGCNCFYSLPTFGSQPKNKYIGIDRGRSGERIYGMIVPKSIFY
jgi:hypothetical protein